LQLNSTTSNFSLSLSGLHGRRALQGDVAGGAPDDEACAREFGGNAFGRTRKVTSFPACNSLPPK